MKERYLNLMEKALSAYTNEQILKYFNDVRENGLTEHGFSRLTCNIGILIAHGKRRDLMPMFLQMMDICACSIPHVKAGNDFSVREVVNCIDVLSKSNAVEKSKLDFWKEQISSINPYECYNVVAKTENDHLFNWALFTAVSEYRRYSFGLGGSLDVIETQLATQVKHLDENGMYRDNYEYAPMTYDLVSRLLFSTLLRLGYKGKYFTEIDSALKKAGVLTLKMQSSLGEIPFGGRSNQFLFNSALLSAIFEYEAVRYSESDKTLSGQFKSASAKALNDIEFWLDKKPISHIKNRFPIDSKYGLESYAYFDKYMITLASYLYEGYLNCEESIKTVAENDTPVAIQTSKYFHAVFLSAGGYSLQFDLNANPNYDANGLGRVHKKGAPSTICLSVPCPIKPHYQINSENAIPLSLCVGVKDSDNYIFATTSQTEYTLDCLESDSDNAKASFTCNFENGKSIKSIYTVSTNGVDIINSGSGEIAYLLPAFYFDGEKHTKIIATKRTLKIYYKGYICKYSTNGRIENLNEIAKNRHGFYQSFVVLGKNSLKVKIEISKI